MQLVVGNSPPTTATPNPYPCPPRPFPTTAEWGFYTCATEAEAGRGNEEGACSP